MKRETSSLFTMPMRLPQLLDLGPLSLEPPTKRDSTYTPGPHSEYHFPSPTSERLSTGPQTSLYPYPPCSEFDSPSDSDDSCDSDAPLPPSGLRTSVAALPENKLRRIMIKLADSNPRFHRAIMKELACAREFTGDALFLDDSPLGTPQSQAKRGRARGRQRERSRKHRPTRVGSDSESSDWDDHERARVHESQRNIMNLSVSTAGHPQHHHQGSSTVVHSHSDEVSTEEYVYHPGHLDEEVYEFFSPSPPDQEGPLACKVVRTVTMWSCCDEDEWSPGCVSTSVPAFADHSLRERDARAMMDLTGSRPFADSDLEHRYDGEDPHGARHQHQTRASDRAISAVRDYRSG